MSLVNVIELKKTTEGTVRDFESVFLFKKMNLKTARNGSEFLVVEVGDRTGHLQFMCFADTGVFQFFKSAEEGSFVHLKGQTSHYQGRFSPKILSAESISEEEVAYKGVLQDLIESSPEDPQLLWNEYLRFMEQIKDDGLRSTVKLVIEEYASMLKEWPAAISMHHAYRHGLLEHTVHVARAAKALLPLYPEVHPDLAITGVLLHDIGKIVEYEGNRSSKKTKIGALQGHVVLGYRIVRKAAIQSKLESNLLERLEHIILSHQGELEWGAAALACTPEAIFVSLVDNLDAKMGMVQQALRNTPDTETFSEYLPGLEISLLKENVIH